MSANFLSQNAAQQLMCATFPHKVAQPSAQLARLFMQAAFCAFKLITAVLETWVFRVFWVGCQNERKENVKI